MGFRITTNMMMNTYRYNLQNNTSKLSDAIEKVQTKRNFNSYAEDPAAATQAFRLRRDYYQTTNQILHSPGNPRHRWREPSGSGSGVAGERRVHDPGL